MKNNHLKPKYIGPGYWTSWHIKARGADTYNKKLEVSRSIAIDTANFPCPGCKSDFTNYINRNPLMVAIKNKDPLSIFYWTVDAHNYVNRKLHKVEMSREDALIFWDPNKFCTEEDCDKEENENENEKVKLTINIKGL